MTTTSDHQSDPTIALDVEQPPRDYISAGQLIEALTELPSDAPLLVVLTDGVHVSFVHLSRLWLNELTGEAALQFGGTEYDYTGALSDLAQHDMFTPVGTKDLLVETGLWLDPEQRIVAASRELLGETTPEFVGDGDRPLSSYQDGEIGEEVVAAPEADA